MKRLYSFVVLILAGCVAVTALYADDPGIILAAAGLREAHGPQLFRDSFLFSYQFTQPPRDGQIHTVGAAFEHEAYSRFHQFQVNEHGIYVLTLTRDPGLSVLRYRLIVDGVWTTDPNAPSELVDRWGVHLSVFTVPQAASAPTRYPAILPDGRVEFRFVTEPGKSVAIVGSFNGWDPFMTRMTETSPGTYTRDIRLTKGEHAYYFMVDGRRYADPANDLQKWQPDGTAVSVVQLP